MSVWLEDLKGGVRSLWKTPGFTCLVVLILALGIGANGAIFSLVDRVLLRPLPYPHPERLVALWETVPGKGELNATVSGPDFEDWRRSLTQLEGISALGPRMMNLSGGQEPERIPAGRVSWNFFQVVGVHPMLGRDFLPEEDREAGPRAVVLTHEFWRRRFNADPTLLGRSIRLDSQDWMVVGILPAGFHLDFQVNSSDVFVPMAMDQRHAQNRGDHFLCVLGRLRPGACLASGQVELRRVAQELEEKYKDTNQGRNARMVSLHSEVAGPFRNTLLMLMGAVAFVLLIACANLMNLMLARGARRERDTAIRTALGASRWQLARQSLTESALLGLLGGVAGLFTATWILSAFRATLSFNGLAVEARLDPRVMVFSVLLSVLTALGSGLPSALHFGDAQLGAALKEAAKGTTGKAHHRLRSLLVSLEMALATVLLIGAGWMLRSLWSLQSVDPGFQSEGVLSTWVSLPAFRYADPPSRAGLVRALIQRAAAIPGVKSASATDAMPLTGSISITSYDIDGAPGENQEAWVHFPSPGYFRSMGIPLIQGRDFGSAPEATVIVNDLFARRHWKGGSALGHRISLDGPGGPWKTIVGVVGSVRHARLDLPPEPAMFFSMLDPDASHGFPDGFNLVLQAEGPAATFNSAVKAALRELDPELPGGNLRPMSRLMERNRAGAHARSTLLAAFAGLALVLAGVGIYGVISFVTGGRTREIGVRMALGAQVGDVLALVLGQGLRMVLVGVAMGLLAALVLGRGLEAVLLGVNPWEKLPLLAAVALLTAIGFLACLIPALKAARVQPTTALRND